MTREELIALVRRLDSAEGTERELHAIMRKLEERLPNADILDLLYHTWPELSAEDAVEEALRRETVSKKPSGRTD